MRCPSIEHNLRDDPRTRPQACLTRRESGHGTLAGVTGRRGQNELGLRKQAQKHADERMSHFSGLTLTPEVRALIRTENAAAYVAGAGEAFEEAKRAVDLMCALRGSSGNA